jgi:hypothetical protein
MHTQSESARGSYNDTDNGAEVRTIKRNPSFRADSLGVRLARDGDTVFEELPSRRGGDHYDDDRMARLNSSGIRFVFDVMTPRRQAKE